MNFNNFVIDKIHEFINSYKNNCSLFRQLFTKVLIQYSEATVTTFAVEFIKKYILILNNF